MSHKNSVLTGIISIVIVVPMILIMVLTAYNSMIYKVLPLPQGIYMVESDNRITFTEFNEDNHVTIFVLEREEGAIRFGAKYEYYATTQGYNHLIGDWYFTSIADSFLLNQTPLSLLSIRKINNGDQKGYINLSLLSCKGIDFICCHSLNR